MFAGDGRLIFIITHDERVKDSFPPDTVTLAVKHGNVTVKILEEISSSKLTETVSPYADDTEDF
jgi:Fe-S cluster assembly ATPase SufC